MDGGKKMIFSWLQPQHTLMLTQLTRECTSACSEIATAVASAPIPLSPSLTRMHLDSACTDRALAEHWPPTKSEELAFDEYVAKIPQDGLLRRLDDCDHFHHPFLFL